MNEQLVQRVIKQAKIVGYEVTAEDVEYFAKWGGVPESTIGEDYDEALTDALQEIFDDYGIAVGG